MSTILSIQLLLLLSICGLSTALNARESSQYLRSFSESSLSGSSSFSASTTTGSLSSGSLRHEQASQTIDQYACCNSSQDATTFALVYGIPLIAFYNYSLPFLQPGGVGTNSLARAVGPAGPNDTSVHHPDPDCTIASALLDLSQNDLVLTVPQFNDSRFWAFSFYDPWGSNYATLSIELHSPPGKYLIRRAEDAGVPWGVTLNDKNNSSPYKGFINSPSTYNVFTNRILALNDTGDLSTAQAYENAEMLSEVRREVVDKFAVKAPALTEKLLHLQYPPGATNVGPQTMTLLARIGYFNQPIVNTDHYRVGAILAQAGINFFTSTYTMPSNVSLDQALISAFESVEKDSKTHVNLGDSWQIQDPQIAGLFYNNYAERAGAGYSGYLGNTANININPSYKGFNSTSVLSQNKAYLLTFHGRVPVIPEFGGFWSVTPYTANGNLVPNILNRYTLGNRDNILYPDGSSVYPQTLNNGTAIGTIASSVVDANETFQFLLQGPTPPERWKSNWVPMPTNQQQSMFKMRVYAPEPGAKNGSYRYPTVEIIDSITV